MALPYQPLSRSQRVWLAAAAAVAIHAAILPFIAKDAVFHFTGRPQRSTVSLIPWNAQQAAAAAASKSRSLSAMNPTSVAKKAEAKTEEEKKKEEEQAKINGQLVSLGPPPDERAPTQPTKYLSEYDSRVLKETRARETSAFYKNALSKVQKEGKNERVDEKPRNPTATPVPPPPGTSAVSGKEGGGQVAKAPTLTTPFRARQDRVQIETAADGTVRNRSASDAMRGDEKRLAMVQPTHKSDTQVEGRGEGAPGGMQGAPNGTAQPLKLTLDNPLQSLGPIAGGPMPDHLPDVNEGDETLLNSRAFRFAGYLNRLKESVGRIWTTDVQDAARTRDPSGQTYLFKDRRTEVVFTLGKSGEILEAKVGSSSGVEFLDRVAVDAFKKAERIPNPPPGLIGESGTVTLGFTFILEAEHGGPLVHMGPAYMPPPPRAGY